MTCSGDWSAWMAAKPAHLAPPRAARRRRRAAAPAAGGPWALVLAAGEGSRLRQLTLGPDGVAVPKQFCSLGAGPSLLHLAVACGWSDLGTPERILRCAGGLPQPVRFGPAFAA